MIRFSSYQLPVLDAGGRYLLASERSERDTLRSVQLRIVDIYIMVRAIRANFVLITRKEGGA